MTMFKQLDRNGDKSVDMKEFEVLNSEGKDQKLKFEDVPKNKKDGISEKEWVMWLKRMDPKKTEKEAMTMFKQLDRNGDKSVDMKEFEVLNSEGEDQKLKFEDVDKDKKDGISEKEWVMWLKRMDPKKTEKEAMTMFGALDRNGDKSVDSKEFDVLNKPKDDDGDKQSGGDKNNEKPKETMTGDKPSGNMGGGNQMSGPDVTPEECTTIGGKWFPYAYKKTECELDGYAFAPNSTGTMMCCTNYRRGGGTIECNEWTNDDTQVKCNACGGLWLSVGKWRSYATWITGKWGKTYQWTDRKLTRVNEWVTQLEQWQVNQAWEDAVMSVRAKPAANFLQCRINPTLETLLSIATAKLPVPSLGKAQVLPGQVSKSQMGDFQVSTSETTNTGKTSISIELKLDSLGNNIGKNSTTKRRRLSVNRRLAAIDVNKMEASCYAVVKKDSKAVGQLIGDCAQFAPSGSLSGAAEVCFTINAAITVNSIFTKTGFAISANNAFTATTLTGVKMDSTGTKLCGGFKTAATYCPIKYLSNWTIGGALPSGFNGADDSCGTLEAQTAIITKQATVLKAAGFTGSGSLVKVGETTPPPSTDPVDTSGGVLGATGKVDDVKTFVSAATEAPTFTTTTVTKAPTTTVTFTKAKSLFGNGKIGEVMTTIKITTITTTILPTTTLALTTTTLKKAAAGGGTDKPATVKFSGSISITATNVTTTQMEAACKGALAKQFNVSASMVTVTATESRRLGDAVARMLAGSWAVQFTITAPASKAAAIESSAAALKATPSNFALAAELTKAGVADVSSLKVTGLTVAKATTTTLKPTTTIKPTTSSELGAANLSSRLLISMPLFALITMLFFGK